MLVSVIFNGVTRIPFAEVTERQSPAVCSMFATLREICCDCGKYPVASTVSPERTGPDTQNTALSAMAIPSQPMNQAIAAIAKSFITALRPFVRRQTDKTGTSAGRASNIQCRASKQSTKSSSTTAPHRTRIQRL